MLCLSFYRSCLSCCCLLLTHTSICVLYPCNKTPPCLPMYVLLHDWHGISCTVLHLFSGCVLSLGWSKIWWSVVCGFSGVLMLCFFHCSLDTFRNSSHTRQCHHSSVFLVICFFFSFPPALCRFCFWPVLHLWLLPTVGTGIFSVSLVDVFPPVFCPPGPWLLLCVHAVPLTTDNVRTVGCSDAQSRYWWVCVGFLRTFILMSPLSVWLMLRYRKAMICFLLVRGFDAVGGVYCVQVVSELLSVSWLNFFRNDLTFSLMKAE